jgi:RNA polymerase sigma-70 factor, ECF subfamily
VDLRAPGGRIRPVGRPDPGSAEAGDDALAWHAGGGSVAAVSVVPDIVGRGRAGRRRSLTRRGQLGEAALVRAAQRGSEEAVEELFTRHWGAAYRAALLVTGDRAAAEDIAQEAFVAALRALPRFDLRRPLRPWLHRIVVNRAIDWSRARAHRREVGADAAPDAPSRDGRNTASVLRDDVAAALLALGPEQRAVIVLRYVLDFTPGEIAAALDLPRGTVNSRLRRGLDALGDLVSEEEPA